MYHQIRADGGGDYDLTPAQFRRELDQLYRQHYRPVRAIDLVRGRAARLGHATLDLPSQAGHDAYFMARVCPTAMIFTPCRGGITHNEREFTTLEEQAPGADLLLQAVIARADRA